MNNMRKPKMKVMLALGVLLSAQCCCCVIPVRWRLRAPEPINTPAEISTQASLVDWGASLAIEIKDLTRNIFPEASVR